MRRHVAVAVLVSVKNSAQRIYHDQPRAVAKLGDTDEIPNIHDVQPFTHNRLKDEVIRDGLASLLANKI